MITRIVMMKMISSTSITSTKGVTLMSDITSPSTFPPMFSAMVFPYLARARGGGFADGHLRLVHPKTHFRARNQVGVQFMGEVTDALLHDLVTAQQHVVAQHRRHGDRQADRGHDQRLADGTRDLVDRRLPGQADRDQRVVDA